MTIESLLAMIPGAVKQIVEYYEGNDEATIKFLTEFLGASEEDKTAIALAVEKAKAEEELGKIW